MQDEVFLVSPEGRWLPEGSLEFLTELGEVDPDYDATMFAVKNLGFIKVELVGDLVVNITVHPRNTELAGITSVQKALFDSPARAFCLRFFTTRWEREILPDAARALERLRDLHKYAHLEDHVASERFTAVSKDYRRLFSDKENALRPILQKWRIAFGTFDDTVLPYMARQGFLRRTVVVGVRPQQPDPVFRYIGDSFSWLGDPDFPYRAVGEKVASQPDQEYGEWVAENYKRAAMQKLPQVDQVDAALRGRGGRTVYERLMLPWTTKSGEVLVTVSSLVTKGVGAPAETPSDPLSMKEAKSS